MGIFFTLLYIFSTYLAPTTIFGDLANYHVEQFIVAFALIGALFDAKGSGVWKMSQSYAVLAMVATVALSLVFNGVWFIAPSAVNEFLSDCIVFFLILWSFRTRFHLRLLVGVLVVVALFTVYQGISAVSRGDTTSPWVYMMGYGEGPKFSRIRGMGFINDPNDLCQFLVALIPCVFVFWRRSNLLANFFLVLLPVSFLLYGMYLTHSRGGLVGLLVALMVLGRRKFGILPAVLTGGGMYVALSAIGWTGGRDISADSGSDRTEAWATGLKLIRSHPIFGVGYKRFEEYFYITAHNTVVVCAAEIGIVGFFFWCLMVIPTMYEVIVAARVPPAKTDGEKSLTQPNAAALQPALMHYPPLRRAFASAQSKPRASSQSITALKTSGSSARGTFSLPASNAGGIDDDEIRRLCGLMIVSLSGFFACGWFLSRSYTMVLFVNIALALCVHRLAVEQGIAPARLTFLKSVQYAAIGTTTLIAIVYAMLRLTNLLPK